MPPKRTTSKGRKQKIAHLNIDQRNRSGTLLFKYLNSRIFNPDDPAASGAQIVLDAVFDSKEFVRWRASQDEAGEPKPKTDRKRNRWRPQSKGE